MPLFAEVIALDAGPTAALLAGAIAAFGVVHVGGIFLLSALVGRRMDAALKTVDARLQDISEAIAHADVRLQVLGARLESVERHHRP